MTVQPEDNAKIEELLVEVKDWQLLHEMSTRLMKVANVVGQLEIVLEMATRLAGSECGVISLYCPKQKGLVTRASRGLNHEALDAISLVGIGEGACGLAFKQCSRVVICDTETDARYANYRGYAARHGIGSVCSSPFYGTDGAPLGVLSIYRRERDSFSDRVLRLSDVCAAEAGLLVSRANAEEALSKELIRNDQILRAMGDGFLVMDREFTVVQINPAALQLDGRAASEILGKTHWDAWPGSEDLELGRRFKDAMASRTAVRFEQWYVHNNENRCFNISAHPFPEGLALFYTEVTAQRTVEREVRDSEKRFFQLANTIPHLAWIADKTGSIYWYNERWFAYTGTTAVEMLGWKWQSVHHPDVLPSVMAKWTASILSGESFEMTFPLRGADGVFRPFYTLVSPLRDDAGEIVQWFGTNTDISALAEADRRKDEFLAMLAHELRNPLAPISTAAQLLQMSVSDNPQVTRAGEIIVRQVRHMTELIDDLLDVSRVTRGLVELDTEVIDLKSVLAAAVEQARPLIESRSHDLHTRVVATSTWVRGDRTRLIQVLSNLLNNAAKYTPHHGQITVSIGVRADEAVISVQDNGSGIPSDLLPHIFDLFSQAERTPDRSQGGLGLGLALVKSIVELHGGSVTAQSPGRGMGTTVEVRLPLSATIPAQVAQSPDKVQPVAHRTLRLVIVDDNEDAAELLATLLITAGHSVTTFYDAETLLSHRFVDTTDVFILDIGLPQIDGHELARKLTTNAAHASAVIIALTGYGQAHDQVLSKAAGFDHHLVKPVDLERLGALLYAIK